MFVDGFVTGQTWLCCNGNKVFDTIWYERVMPEVKDGDQ